MRRKTMDVSAEKETDKRIILVTGGAGFIGTHLCAKLVDENYQVRVLDIADPKRTVKRVKYIRGNILDAKVLAEAMSEVSSVFHFAAIVSVMECQQNPLNAYETNSLGTSRVLDAVRLESIRRNQLIRFFFASSSAVYGKQGHDGRPLNEQDLPHWTLSHYGAQKMGAEQLVRLYHDFHGIPSLSFRFFNAYGPGQDSSSPYCGVISAFRSSTDFGTRIQLHGGGHQTRDFIHVSDIVQACNKALSIPESFCNGEAINLGTGRATSIRQLANIICEIKGIPPLLIETEPRAGDILHSLADHRKAKSVLNWDPQIKLEFGLSQLAEHSRL